MEEMQFLADSKDNSIAPSGDLLLLHLLSRYL